MFIITELEVERNEARKKANAATPKIILLSIFVVL
jgi:hypothetical protein